MMGYRLQLATVVVLCAACQAPVPRAYDTPAANAAIDSVWVAYAAALAAGNATTFANLYSDSAVFAIQGSATLRGRPAIEQAARAYFAAARFTGLTILPIRRVFDSRYVVEIADFTQTFVPANAAAQTAYGRHLVTLERGPTGRYQIVLDAALQDSAHASP
jgi:uncharacterized protein (TIGR02246 family)